MQKIVIVYWSGTGNTEMMANAVMQGVTSDDVDVTCLSVSSATTDQIEQADAVALGCPSMGDEVLEEDEFEPFVTSIEGLLSGKKLALFGSYGWGDGEWMRNWQARMEKTGATLVSDGLILNEEPDDDGIAQCKELGAKLK